MHDPRPGGGEGGTLPPFRATLWLVVAVAILFLVVGVALQLFLGELGLLLTQWGLILGAVLVFVRVGGYDPGRTLSLRRPGGREALAAFLLIAGGTPLAWFLSWIQGFFLPMPVEFLEAMRDFLVTDDPLRILWLLVLVAFTPAVCEEFLFRGVFLAGSRGRFSTPAVLLLNGAVFGLFHLSPQTAFRFIPTAWLGCLLAVVVWRTGSIWLAVGMHFLNNATILLLTVAPGLREHFQDVEQAPPFVLLPFALAALAFGFHLLWRSGSGGPGSASPAFPPLRRSGTDDGRNGGDERERS